MRGRPRPPVPSVEDVRHRDKAGDAGRQGRERARERRQRAGERRECAGERCERAGQGRERARKGSDGGREKVGYPGRDGGERGREEVCQPRGQDGLWGDVGHLVHEERVVVRRGDQARVVAGDERLGDVVEDRRVEGVDQPGQANVEVVLLLERLDEREDPRVDGVREVALDNELDQVGDDERLLQDVALGDVVEHHVPLRGDAVVVAVLDVVVDRRGGAEGGDPLLDLRAQRLPVELVVAGGEVLRVQPELSGEDVVLLRTRHARVRLRRVFDASPVERGVEVLLVAKGEQLQRLVRRAVVDVPLRELGDLLERAVELAGEDGELEVSLVLVLLRGERRVDEVRKVALLVLADVELASVRDEVARVDLALREPRRRDARARRERVHHRVVPRADVDETADARRRPREDQVGVCGEKLRGGHRGDEAGDRQHRVVREPPVNDVQVRPLVADGSPVRDERVPRERADVVVRPQVQVRREDDAAHSRVEDVHLSERRPESGNPVGALADRRDLSVARLHRECRLVAALQIPQMQRGVLGAVEKRVHL